MSSDKPQTTPAEIVIEKLGGIARTAELLKLDRSVVNRWKLPKSSGGTGGLIPAKHQSPILAIARRHGIALTAADLICCSEAAA